MKMKLELDTCDRTNRVTDYVWLLGNDHIVPISNFLHSSSAFCKIRYNLFIFTFSGWLSKPRQIRSLMHHNHILINHNYKNICNEVWPIESLKEFHVCAVHNYHTLDYYRIYIFCGKFHQSILFTWAHNTFSNYVCDLFVFFNWRKWFSLPLTVLINVGRRSTRIYCYMWLHIHEHICNIGSCVFAGR